MISIKILLLPAFLFSKIAAAQDYSIEYIYYPSQNSRIKQNGKIGLIDKNNNIIIPALYDELTDLHADYSRVVKDDKVGFVNAKGEILISCMYEKDENLITGATISYVNNSALGVIEITVGTDERRLCFYDDMVCVVLNGKYGFVNKENKVVIPFQYDGADNFFDSIAIVKLKDKFGAIDINGKLIIPFIYELLVWNIGIYGQEVLYAKKEGRYFFMDKNRKSVRNFGEQ